VYVAWARNDRSALVRVPGAKRGKAASTRVEFRSPDPACNPYLAFSVILAAGLAGIEEGYDLPPELTANLYDMTAEERAAEGVTELPGSLEEAIHEMEHSELVAGRVQPEEGWPGALVWAVDDPEAAFALCRSLRKRDLPLEPLLLVVAARQVGELELREDLFDDFCIEPAGAGEVEARLAHL